MWNSIVSVPDHCLFIYVERICDIIHRYLDLDAGKMYLARAHRHLTGKLKCDENVMFLKKIYSSKYNLSD